MRSVLISYVLTLSCLFICKTTFSQSNVRKLILDAYSFSLLPSSDDIETVEKIRPFKQISEDIIKQESDSIQYMYHYCLAALYYLEENSTESLRHIEIAIQLRENSIGIQHAEYLELLCGKAGLIEDSDPIKAMRTYQHAYVVGQSLLRSKDDVIIYWYGQCLWHLGDMYIKRNYIQQVISLYKDAFQLTAKYFDVPSISILCIAPIQQLEDFYYSRKEYDKAVSVCDDLLSFLTQHDAQETEHYAQTLSFKAASLEKMGSMDEAISCYEKSIAIRKVLSQLEESITAYGNLHLLYLKENAFEKADSLEKEYIPILIQRDDLRGIIVQYYAASYILSENTNFEKSETYIDKSFPLMTGMDDELKEMIYSQKSKLRFRQNDIQSALQYKELAIAHSSTDIKRFKNQIDHAFLISTKDKDQGIEEYDRILRGMEVHNLDTIPIYESTISQIVDIYVEANDYQKEIEFLGDILYRFSTKYGKESKIYADYMNMQGVGYLKLNDGSQALPIFEQAKQIYIDLNQQNTIDFAVIVHNMGRAYMLLNKNENALQYLLISKQLQKQLTGSVMEKTQEYIDTINRMGK